MLGKQILNYEIKSLLGEGGMGYVYLAEHVDIGRKVAIKAILPQLVSNDEIKSRFLNEAATMSKLQHPNIVTLYDYVSNEDGLFLIMEYVEGVPLDEYMNKLGKPLDEDLALEFTKQLVSACEHAHQKEIVHRDIKPPNMMITNEGVVKILDFGIAKVMNDEVNKLTKTGAQMGTVYYMSPEQVKGGDISPRTDIYSIGVTLYQMVTGMKPYTDLTTEYQIYEKIVKEDLPDPRTIRPELSVYVGKVIAKATRKDPEHRFKNCTDFKKVLDEQNEYRLKYNKQSNPIQVTRSVKTSANNGHKPISQKSINGPDNKIWMSIISLMLGLILFMFSFAWLVEPWILNISLLEPTVLLIALFGLSGAVFGLLYLVLAKGTPAIRKVMAGFGMALSLIAILFSFSVRYPADDFYWEDSVYNEGDYYEEEGYYEESAEESAAEGYYYEDEYAAE